MCVCMYAYIYIYVYIYVYIHTFIYTRTHTYILCGSPHLCQTAVSLAWQADIHAHPRRYLDVSRGQVVGVGLVSSVEEKRSLQVPCALAFEIRPLLGVLRRNPKSELERSSREVKNTKSPSRAPFRLHIVTSLLLN